jgi:TrmH family RNA methyltransferase
VITSTRNPRIAAVRRLRRSRERRATGLTTVEGPFLLEEAIVAGAEIHEVFVTAGDARSTELCDAAGVHVTAVSAAVLESLAGSVAPRGPVAVVSIPESDELRPVDTVVLWDISDPGNAGTIIRTAGAFGFQVASTAGSVDLWSPKVVRAGVGGHFRASLVTGLPADPSVLHAAGLRPLVATAAAEQSAAEMLRGSGAVAVIVGNEARGVPDAVSKASNVEKVSLPMPGGTESLNAGVAAGILMYLRMATK